MRIYVDFDDVLCETARALSVLAKGMFGRDVPYENIEFFNLQKAFSLTDDEIDRLMGRAHEPDFLETLEPTPGAVEGLRALGRSGHEVTIVTGRQSTCHAGTQAWLRRHGLDHLEVIYVDKYGRASGQPAADVPPMLDWEAFNTLHFDVAIDDSPTALSGIGHRKNCRIFIFQRPWNAAYQGTEGMHRVTSWPELVSIVADNNFF